MIYTSFSDRLSIRANLRAPRPEFYGRHETSTNVTVRMTLEEISTSFSTPTAGAPARR